jgi:hypothetical protein
VKGETRNTRATAQDEAVSMQTILKGKRRKKKLRMNVDDVRNMKTLLNA